MSTERWLPIPGWEGVYEVSSRGRVRSVPRAVRSRPGVVRRTKATILRPGITRGYERVSLQRDGEVVNRAVHRLVLEAFVGPCPPGMEACHNDDNRRHNDLSNLRWDTKSANHLDRTRNGRNPNALKTHCPQGHPYDDANTAYEKNGARKCRACRSRRAVEYKRRIRARRQREALAA